MVLPLHLCDVQVATRMRGWSTRLTFHHFAGNPTEVEVVKGVSMRVPAPCLISATALAARQLLSWHRMLQYNMSPPPVIHSCFFPLLHTVCIRTSALEGIPTVIAVAGSNMRSSCPSASEHQPDA